ncbi:MAG: hypothetical protein NXH97_05645 [Rhodobacteraceae bacterium]|nr:hypothetical protein [Paracoccaceae bacterium]
MTLYEFLVPVLLAIPAIAGVLWLRYDEKQTLRALQQERIKRDPRD